ncbi:MAG: serine hydroxymethyltransferase [Planctomycetota bacterium]
MTTATPTATESPAADQLLQDVLQPTDPAIAKLIAAEQLRQEHTLEMIASENHTSPAVMATVGSCLTNKYAEGYPGKRYYSGCTYYDQIESLAIDRACELFNAGYANVQPHSGANANLAVFMATLNPGDTYLSIELSEGGHLTHGSPVNLSGKWFKPVHYPLINDESSDRNGHIDYEQVLALAKQHKPKLIICGFSAYPRTIDFAKFREAADACGATLLADISHISGLIAGGSHPSPFPHCDIVSTTTHKTLRGPRGGLLLTNDEEMAKALNKAIFPGSQGGPLMHVIAGKAVAFGEALKPEFQTYAQQVITNAQALATELLNKGYTLASGGTDNHLLLIDLRPTTPDLTGKLGAEYLEQAGIIANRNTVPNETRSPFQTSGVRLGTPALTTRGLTETHMPQVADLLHRALSSEGDAATLDTIRHEVVDLCKQFPMPH